MTFAVNKNSNYLYIKDGEIKQHDPSKYDIADPSPSSLKELRDKAIECYREWTERPPYDLNARLEKLNRYIEIINGKIEKYNEKLTCGCFGWLFSLFKMNKAYPYQIKVTSSTGKAKDIESQLYMLKNGKLDQCILLVTDPSSQTVITYNPVSMKFFLVVGHEAVVVNGIIVKRLQQIELKIGKKNVIDLPRFITDEYKPARTITIEIS